MIGLAAATEPATPRDRRRGDRLNACPCAQGLVRERAAERLGEAGFAEVDVERILELVPLATHNQRGRGFLYLGNEAADRGGGARLARRAVDELSDLRALKRPDELFVVEHAHLTPRFVEDSVRLMVKSAVDEYPELPDDDFVLGAPGQLRDDPQPRGPRASGRDGR